MKTTNPLITLAMILIAASFAAAHALPDHSEPRVGSTVNKAPTEVRIYFNQDLEPAFSHIQVFDASGKEVDKKDSHLDPGNKRLLIVSLPTLGAGQYKVKWQVVSIDTHRTQNDFKFEIKP
jgi:methionine-rich copper-binding protein CopC